MLSTYELALILAPSADEKTEISAISKLVEKQGAKAAGEESWGKKMFSYPIEKQKEGIYIFLKLKGEPAVSSAIHSMLRTRESILRYLLLKVAEEKTLKKGKAEEVIKSSKKRGKIPS